MCRNLGGVEVATLRARNDTTSTLWHQVGQQWARTEYPMASLELPSPVDSILFDTPDGAIWTTARAGWLLRMYDNTWSIQGLGLPSDRRLPVVTAAFRDSNGEVWAVTDSAEICRYSDGVWSLVYEEQTAGLVVEQIVEDRTGTHWLRYANGQLGVLEGSTVRMVTSDETGGLVPSALTLAALSDGSLWVGTRGNGAVRYDDGAWEHAAADTMDVHLVYEDGQGAVWVHARAELFYGFVLEDLFIRFDSAGSATYDISPITRQPFTNDPEQAESFVTRMATDSAGRVWAVGRNGAFFYEDSTWTLADGDYFWDPRVPARASDVAIDHNGSVWLCGGSIVRMSGDTVKAWYNDSVVSADFGSIASMLAARNGTVWMRNTAGDVIVHDNGTAAIAHGRSPTRSVHPGGGRLWIAQHAATRTILVDYTLPQSGHATIAVYDMHGRRVAVLLGSNRPAGAGRVSWRWADQGVAPGSYVVRLSTAGVAASGLLQVRR